MPTSAPNGFNNTLHKCKLRSNKRKFKPRHRHSYRLNFEERRGFWVNHSRRCILDSLHFHRQSPHQLQYCQVSLSQHSHNKLLLVREQHRLPGLLVSQPLLLVLFISRNCRSLPQTRCTYNNRHLHTSYNRLKMRRSNRRHLFTSTIGCLRHRNRRSTQAAIYQRRPQVNTKPRPPPHTNLVSVRRLMRLTVSTSAPPRSGRPKALTQRLHPLHRHTSPIHRRPSHMFRRHRHQHLDHEDMHEPVQMHLQEAQRVQ